jgi:hypothetical protein
MPPLPRTSGPVALALLTALGLGALWVVVRYPWAPLLASLILVTAAFADRDRRSHLRQLTRERAGESLCTFARSFPRKERDPWILRAVHEELSSNLGIDGKMVPIRPSDRLNEDLRLDSEDLELWLSPSRSVLAAT